MIKLVREVFFDKVVSDNGEKLQCNLKFVILVGAFKSKALQVQQVMKVLLDRGLKIGGCLKSFHI